MTYFYLATQTLGTTGYGKLAAIIALCSVIGPFIGLGSGHVMLQEVARTPANHSVYFGNALGLCLVTGLVASSLVVIICQNLLFMHETSFLTAIILSELICAPIFQLCTQSFQSIQDNGSVARLQILMPLIRISGLLLVNTYLNLTLTLWTCIHFLSGVFTCLAALWFIQQKFSKPKITIRISPGALLNGCYYALGLATYRSCNDADKTIMAKYATLDATGLYAGAYRVMEIILLPISALHAATYASFFIAGQTGVGSAQKYFNNILHIIVIYGLLATIISYFFLPKITLCLGESFTTMGEIIQYLAFLPLLHSLHIFAASVLVGSKHLSLYTTIQVALSVLNISMNLYLIPSLSWQGAVYSTFITELSAILLFSSAIVLAIRNEARVEVKQLI